MDLQASMLDGALSDDPHITRRTETYNPFGVIRTKKTIIVLRKLTNNYNG